MLTGFVKVATVASLADGELLEVNAEGDQICLARVGDQYYAVGLLCTHMHTWLDGGFIIRDSLEVRCPLHNSRFSLLTGESTGPPATEPVAAYAVRIEDGDVLVGPKT